MSEKSAQPRYTSGITMNTVTKMIKTLSSAIAGCGASCHWPSGPPPVD